MSGVSGGGGVNVFVCVSLHKGAMAGKERGLFWCIIISSEVANDWHKGGEVRSKIAMMIAQR